MQEATPKGVVFLHPREKKCLERQLRRVTIAEKLLNVQTLTSGLNLHQNTLGYRERQKRYIFAASLALLRGHRSKSCRRLRERLTVASRPDEMNFNWPAIKDVVPDELVGKEIKLNINLPIRVQHHSLEYAKYKVISARYIIDENSDLRIAVVARRVGNGSKSNK
jgi:hypothetical protein